MPLTVIGPPARPSVAGSGRLLGGREIMIARLIDPKPMRLEIGRRRDLRQGQLPLAAQRGNDLRGQEMRIDNKIPRPLLDQLNELTEVELLECQAQRSVRFLPERLG